MPPITIKEVARKAGVSVATVSRAINPHTAGLVKPSTKNSILNIIKKSHYTPSEAAKRLVTGKSHNIFLFLGAKYRSMFYSDYYMKLMTGVMDVLENTNYNLIVRMLKIKESRFDLNRMIQGVDVAGIIVCHLQTELEVSDIGIRNIKIPTVILNKIEYKNDLSFVACDHFQAGYEATKYLINLGHKKIAIIRGPDDEPDAVQRFRGYKDALKDHAIPFMSSYVLKGNFTEDTGFKGIEKFIHLNERPTAVFCSNDDIAIGALMKIKEVGMKCPDDISIIGFDGIDAGRYLIPPLTTMQQPIYEMARESARALVSRMEEDINIKGVKIFNAKLIEGGTCSAPAETGR